MGCGVALPVSGAVDSGPMGCNLVGGLTGNFLEFIRKLLDPLNPGERTPRLRNTKRKNAERCNKVKLFYASNLLRDPAQKWDNALRSTLYFREAGANLKCSLGKKKNIEETRPKIETDNLIAYIQKSETFGPTLFNVQERPVQPRFRFRTVTLKCSEGQSTVRNRRRQILREPVKSPCGCLRIL